MLSAFEIGHMNYYSPVSSPRQSSRKHRRFVSSPAQLSTHPQTSESNSFESPAKNDKKKNTTFLLKKSSSHFGSNKVFKTAWKEARGVWIWSVTSFAFQLFCVFLVSGNTKSDHGSEAKKIDYWMNPQIIHVLTGNVLSLFPKKVSTNQAPGFFYSSPWILLIIRKHYGVSSNIPIRISEMVLGRLT